MCPKDGKMKSQRLEELCTITRCYPPLDESGQLLQDNESNVPGHNRIHGLVTLCELILTPESIVIQTGTASGVSAEVFAHYCKQITSVDEIPVFGGQPPRTDATVNGVVIGLSAVKKYQNLKMVRADSLKYAAEVTEKADLVYLDSCHYKDFVIKEIGAWRHVVKPGGYIGGHDYCPYTNQPVFQAVNSVFLCPDYVFPDSSWLKRL